MISLQYLEYIIYGLLISASICGLIYLFSRVQMKGWMHEFNKQLMNQIVNKLNKEKDERKKE
jgi:uncharacterized membrane protein YciS (DUF1049 family)